MTKQPTFPYVPPEQRMLQVLLGEHRAPWGSWNPIARVLDVLEAAPWGPPVEMQLDLLTWVPYERATAIREAWNGPNQSVGVRTRAELGIQASVAHNDIDNTVGLLFLRSAYETLRTEGVELAIESLIVVLREFCWATAIACDVEIIALRGEPSPPPPFVMRGWLHVLHPRIYPRFIERDALLATPADVRERSDGTIWIRSYPDPLAYDTDEAVDGMRAVSRHFRHHARPWQRW